MIYLINVLGVWLLLAAAFAALAGWALAAEQGAPADAALRRERDKLVRDLAQLARGEGEPQPAVAGDADAARSLAAIRESRIAELESALTQSRSRADDASAQASELQRRLEQSQSDAAELARLRALVDRGQAGQAQAIESQAEPASDEEIALQAWRLRYFEQRVRFLESQAANPPAPPAAPSPEPVAPVMEWRAREAEARADFLAQELRERETAAAASETPVSAFAASPDVDMLLRWRLLYLERRVAYLQERVVSAAAPAPELDVRSAVELDKWKWRARYLEARVRHLEERAAIALETPAPKPEPAAAPAPEVAAERPPLLPAPRSGAPDDLTLIEGMSPLQQSTLNSLGVYHFDQIAAWTPENVAWVDRYLRLRGRIGEEEWVEQAGELAREGLGDRALAEHDA
jgi:predicted flap endonuclease-1-like 5' DNA nuclease